MRTFKKKEKCRKIKMGMSTKLPISYLLIVLLINLQFNVHNLLIKYIDALTIFLLLLVFRQA